MNRLERLVYDALSNHPSLKWRVRQLYQLVFDWVPVPRERSAYPIVPREGFFFGFHDHTPFSPGNQLLAAGCCGPMHGPLRMPGPQDLLEVGYFDGEGFTRWNPVGRTRAWNWHQGCKLQWRGPSRSLVYNDHEDGRDMARIADVETGTQAALPRPVATVSADGRWAVGYSFERVNRYMPGYGYGHVAATPELERERPEQDGIFLQDLDSGRDQLLLSIADIASRQPEPAMEGAYHYFSHAIFSPSSERFVFLHRWIHDDVTRRWSRLISSDLAGQDIHIFPTEDLVSHLCWRNADELLAYCRLRDGRARYVFFDDRDPGTFEIVGEGQLADDGHPSSSPDGRWFVTDTYADRLRRQHLILYDAKVGRRYDLARLKTYRRFASPSLYQHWACDLHPRFDRAGRYLCFDATFTGARALCTMDLGDALQHPETVRAL